MQRLPFVLLCKSQQKTAGLNALCSIQAIIRKNLNVLGADNVSIWGIQDFLFCYGEYPDDILPSQVTQAVYCSALSPYFDLLPLLVLSL